MIRKLITGALEGIEGTIIEVEADVANGLPQTNIVGLPDLAVRESRQRVKAALKNSGFSYPLQRITVNLAPADVQKAGTHFDLPIALSILLASGQLNFDPAGKMFIGELSLDGALRPVGGVLSMALAAQSAGLEQLYIPAANAAEAALVRGLRVYPVDSIYGLAAHLRQAKTIVPTIPVLDQLTRAAEVPEVDFSQVKGQQAAKRALQVAAAGRHNLLMCGPPGSGKTFMARAILGILPPLSFEESLELTKIYSVALPAESGVVNSRPFRSPHHTISAAALIGGGAVPRPGEITLAHKGILFLDELPEFSRYALEALRQPLEDGTVTISRAKRTFRFASRCAVVAAMNPCPCGFFGETGRQCLCTPARIRSYRNKISGPLLDRIDIQISVPQIQYAEWSIKQATLSSADMRAQVQAAWSIQSQRLGPGRVNSEMTDVEVNKHCALEPGVSQLLERAVERYQLSARAIMRILKISRTIADLEQSRRIAQAHVAEAVGYRTQVGI
jgi:magnesium chelatase family protein